MMEEVETLAEAMKEGNATSCERVEEKSGKSASVA